MTLEHNYEIKSLSTPAAEGGTVTTSGGYRIHTFTSSETLTVNKSMNVEVLVVAGGGPGGRAGAGAGGGGGGGIIYNPTYAITPGSKTVTIGATKTGSTGSGYSSEILYGNNSVFDTLTALGGGGGSSGNNAAGNGGCGGGGDGGYATIGGSGSQGYNGGNGYSTDAARYGGGGGGGAGGTGTAGYYRHGGIGGIGYQSSISGTATYYAGGGGGGVQNYYGDETPGTGGLGGGGNGSISSGANATANTGGGGGGGGTTNSTKGGDGASGIVIIRYLLSEDTVPASITATSMTVLPNDIPCRVGICTIGVSVTWTNNGGSTGSFVPSITVSNGTVAEIYPSEQVTAGLTATHSFTISGMTIGPCSICPNPN